jgi:MFS family permease
MKAEHDTLLHNKDVLASDGGRFSRYAWRALAASVVGYTMDAFDLLIIAFMLGAISVDLHLTQPEAGLLATWTLVGAVVGGLGFGVLSDYFGRVRVLRWTILVFAVFTGLCALAQGYRDLLAYRFLAGLGLGGEFGIGMALMAEACPAELRARASSYVAAGGQAGVVLAALLTPLLLPLIGWRGMFVVGIFPALVALVLRRVMAEPDIYLERRRAPRTAMPLGLLVKDTATRRITFAMVILCSVQNFGYYGLMIWLPSYLSNRFDYTLTRSGVWTAVTVLGMSSGMVAFGHLADRIGRRPTFFFYQTGAVIMVFVYSQLVSASALLVCGAMMGFFVGGTLTGIATLMSELYPTEARATAQNVLFNVGRGVGGFGPVVVGSLAAAYSFSVAIALLALIYILALVVTALLIPERKGKPLT